MPKWFYGEYGGVNVDDGDIYEEVEHLGDAIRLHNADIDALTARAEAAEAKIAELQRRLDAVVEIFSHDENNPYNCIGRYELYDIAVAIAEGRDHE